MPLRSSTGQLEGLTGERRWLPAPLLLCRANPALPMPQGSCGKGYNASTLVLWQICPQQQRWAPGGMPFRSGGMLFRRGLPLPQVSGVSCWKTPDLHWQGQGDECCA